MLWLIPAGAEPQVQAATGDVVERHGLLGQQRWVPERVRADQYAHANTARYRCQPGQQRPRFEIRPSWPTRLDEVVAVPGAVEAERFEEPPPFHKGLPGLILICDNPEAHLV